MKWRAIAVAIITTALLGSCGNAERPEGIVERWLTSLNQGAAGRPGIYASAVVSEQVLPRWRMLEPGELDVIQVVKGAAGEGGVYQVPFRVETIGGEETRAIADVVRGRVTGIVTSAQTPVDRLLFEDREPIGSISMGAWLTSLGLALASILAAAGLMTLINRSAAGPPPAPGPGDTG